MTNFVLVCDKLFLDADIAKSIKQQLKTLSYHVALHFSDTHPGLELSHTGTFLILPKLHRVQTLGHTVTFKHFI